MNPKKKCPNCGSTQLEAGTLQTTGRVHFRPKNAKFLTLGTGDVPIKANLCMECGVMMLVGDLTKAIKLVGKK
jgi:ribosomal protein S27AE